MNLEDCHYKGSKDLLCLYLNNNEESELFLVKVLGKFPTNCFNLSAILIENMPIWGEAATPSNKISLMSEWKPKLQHYQRN
jgi:hypothetical protein